MASEDPFAEVADESPERRVGAAMRRARASAGISLRQMAKRLHYGSHSTLSMYERGDAMPSEEAVLGYERVLGLDSGSLLHLLREANTERHGDEWPKRQGHAPAETTGTKADEPQDLVERTDEGAQILTRVAAGWVRPWKIAVIAGSMALLTCAVVIAILMNQHGKSKVQRESPSGPALGSDGSDPKVTGCALGATNTDSVDVFYPSQHLAGTLELRASVRCGTSWGRFTPTSALSRSSGLTIEIDMHRPADDGSAPFSIKYDGQVVYGNMLVSRYECVYAEIEIKSVDLTSAKVRTRCVKTPSS